MSPRGTTSSGFHGWLASAKTKRDMKSSIFLISFLGLSLSLSAQPLGQIVSMSYTNTPLRVVLSELEQNYQLQFSYSPDRIPVARTVSIRLEEEPLSAAMDDICAQLPIQYRAMGRQILLKPAPAKQESLGQLETPLGKVRQQSPIYPRPVREVEERKRLGRQMPTMPQHQITLLDRPGGDALEKIDFDLYRLPPPPTPVAEPKKDKKGYDSDQRLAQISLLPFLGTNQERSAEITNNLSVNLLWGTNGGVDGLEVGTFYNRIINDVNGAQLAGLGSSVGGDVSGTQISGLFNTSNGNINGLQAAGLFNHSGEGGRAIQAAGLYNVSGGGITGVQAAGLFNQAGGDMGGLQVAALFNHSKGASRSQVAALFNRSGDLHGGQVAMINKAKNVSGFQIGLINIADTVSGVPVGLLNIVRNGYNRVEISANDALFANLSLKLGARSFYNIFQAGLRWDDWPSAAGNVSIQGGSAAAVPASTQYTWGLGYGLGTTRPLNQQLMLNIEAVSMHINELGSWTTDLNLLNQLRLTLDYHGKGRRSSFFAGPVANLMISKLTDAETGQLGSQAIQPAYQLWEAERNATHYQFWVGVQAGVRF